VYKPGTLLGARLALLSLAGTFADSDWFKGCRSSRPCRPPAQSQTRLATAGGSCGAHPRASRAYV
jgi:hypothetical protein